MNNIEFTVFTPTYNRGSILEQSYKALCKQTCKNFVWLIVDDGSTDNTGDLVRAWQRDSTFHIEYVYQDNAGKQRAVNTGIDNCKTKYFGFLDSDDYYCPDTVERFLRCFDLIANNQKVAGVMARRGHDENSPAGSTNVPRGSYILNFDRFYRKYHFYGDTCRAYKTDILKEYKYPMISEKFIPEGVMLSAIDQKYDLLIVNEVFSISEYLEDGYTRNSHRLYKRNPYGYALGLSQIAASKRGFFRVVKYNMMFTVWCKANNISGYWKLSKSKVCFVMIYPVSYMLYLLKIPKWYFDEGEK